MGASPSRVDRGPPSASSKFRRLIIARTSRCYKRDFGWYGQGCRACLELLSSGLQILPGGGGPCRLASEPPEDLPQTDEARATHNGWSLCVRDARKQAAKPRPDRRPFAFIDPTHEVRILRESRVKCVFEGIGEKPRWPITNDASTRRCSNCSRARTTPRPWCAWERRYPTSRPACTRSWSGTIRLAR